MSLLLMWVFLFLYSVFFLGGIPLPPMPGRPFLEDGDGESRFYLLDSMSRTLTELSARTPFAIAVILLVGLFLIWFALRYRREPRRTRTSALVFSFFFLFATALTSADYSREILATDVVDYASRRTEWITHGADPGYPRWPTEVFVNVLITRMPGDFEAALDGVIQPEFGRIPAYGALAESCKSRYREIFNPTKSGVQRGIANERYGPACSLLKEIVRRIGKSSITTAQDCFYGPAVKVLHALDRQKLRCGLDDPDTKATTCSQFANEFGTVSFSFCKGVSSDPATGPTHAAR